MCELFGYRGRYVVIVTSTAGFSVDRFRDFVDAGVCFYTEQNSAAHPRDTTVEMYNLSGTLIGFHVF
jgi:hypothetical protein